MITRYESGDVSWYDVLNPSAAEINKLSVKCSVPPSFLSDLTIISPHIGSTVEKTAIKLVLDFPIVKRNDLNRPHQLKFIATKKSLITIRFEDMQAIDGFAKDFEVITLLRKADKTLTGGNLLTALLLRLYKGLDDKLDYLTARMHEIDNEIFNEHEREMVKDIAEVGRRFIGFRQTVEAHESALGVLYSNTPKVFDKAHQSEVLRINEQFMHIIRRLNRLTLSLKELRETNNSLITTKQNEIMKTLTIMAFVTFPLTLVSSLFGMNTITTPIVGRPGDFWMIVGFMSMGFVCFFIYFRYKKWL